MTVINSRNAETINITSNGQVDVARYTTANVDVPASIESLSITPSTSSQEITAPSGTDGYSPITVSAVTSSIDANIVAGNIKKNVQILGVTGTYEGSGGGGALTMQFRKGENNELLKPDTPIVLTGITEIPEFGLAYAYRNVTDLTGSIDFSGITTLGVNALNYAFSGSGLTGEVDLSHVTTIESAALNYAFNGSKITSVKLSGTASIAPTYTFSNCSELVTADLSGYNGGLGSMFFSSCPKLKTADCRNVTTLTAQCFSSCSSLETLNLEHISTLSVANVFRNCSSLTNLDISGVTSITTGFTGGFYDCASLKELRFTSISTLTGGSVLLNKISTSVKNIYFPNLGTVTAANILNGMLNGNDGCTLHFPWNLDPQTGSTVISKGNQYPNFGGTNTVLLYDQPGSKPLRCADGLTYVRNPKFDTATALAWRFNTNVFEPFYTVGTFDPNTPASADPQVGDTLYSDAECTTAVTTISSIG